MKRPWLDAWFAGQRPFLYTPFLMQTIVALLGIIFNTIAPIFLVIAATILVERRFSLDVRTLSRLSIYLLSPALFLQTLSETTLQTGEVAAIFGASFVICLLMALLGWGITRLLRLPRPLASAFILTVFIMNSVNFGYPFLEFALGPEAIDTAVIYSLGQVLLAYGLGTFIASRGRSSWKVAVGNVLTLPMLYAFLLGLWLNVNDLALPLPIARSVEVLSRAVVPVTLVILGLQLSHASLRGRWRLVLAATVTRFGVGAAVAVAVAGLFGLSGLSRQVVILEGSMPSGMLGGVLTTEFGGDAQFAAAVILFTTLTSGFFLSLILLYVTGGV